MGIMVHGEYRVQPFRQESLTNVHTGVVGSFGNDGWQCKQDTRPGVYYRGAMRTRCMAGRIGANALVLLQTSRIWGDPDNSGVLVS